METLATMELQEVMKGKLKGLQPNIRETRQVVAAAMLTIT